MDGHRSGPSSRQRRIFIQSPSSPSGPHARDTRSPSQTRTRPPPHLDGPRPQTAPDGQPGSHYPTSQLSQSRRRPPRPSTAATPPGADRMAFVDSSIAEYANANASLGHRRGRSHDAVPLDMQSGYQDKGKTPALRLETDVPSIAIRSVEIERKVSNTRDSILTQGSTESSIYPASTPTDTDMTTTAPPSPLSPLSPVRPNHALNVSLGQLHQSRLHDFNADDVSYRLRLMVKNNYFLPPMHTKPFSYDISTPITSTKKSPVPSFLDFLRPGKSRAAPPTPPAERTERTLVDPMDQSPRSSYFPPENLRPQTNSAALGCQNRVSRVVVVRERMEDLPGASKKAERELKAQSFAPRVKEFEAGYLGGRQEAFTGIIDPTDAVDMPLPTSDYPFAIQASEHHGLGVADSLGAAVLADHLPPPLSPGQSSVDSKEHAWRKDILSAAVGYSLSNSVASSSSVASASVSGSPVPSPAPRSSSSSVPKEHRVPQALKLDKRILSPPPRLDSLESQGLPSSSPGSPPSSGQANRPRLTLQAPVKAEIPYLRSETPVPHTPLSPRPNKHPKSLHSMSHSDLHSSQKSETSRSGALRKSASSPLLTEPADAFRGPGALTPSPPPLPPALSLSPAPGPSSRYSRESRASTASSSTTKSFRSRLASFEVDPTRRTSAATMATHDRALTPEDTRTPSPTASAFQDRVSEVFYTAPSEASMTDQFGEAARSQSRASSSSRVTRPPRSSSRRTPANLHPPPQPSPYLHSPSTKSRSSSITSRSSSTSGHHRNRHGTIRADDIQGLEFLEEASSVRKPSFLDMSAVSHHSGVHVAPPPASPADFFDHIENNALDDDESESDTETGPSAMPSFSTSFIAPSQPYLGVFYNSSPDVSMGGSSLGGYHSGGGGGRSRFYSSSSHSKPNIPAERRTPVGNTPNKGKFFSSKTKLSPSSLAPLQLAMLSRDRLSEGDERLLSPGASASASAAINAAVADQRGTGAGPSRGSYAPVGGYGPSAGVGPSAGPAVGPGAAAEENVKKWQREQRADESSRKLDEQVLKFIEGDKARMKELAMKHKTDKESQGKSPFDGMPSPRSHAPAPGKEQ
ncbi:hypothetical protein CONPUDRAFT_70906 [Coniophora puteana RWD-64-598 SS2]|uniref:Uncharacterized protein n=1 Tax=Coniophora puteana (strain RWD-64-598) TaxID=741705 RepID=A0A5M3MYC7_CONPW|nr:uncharacterized protein CONPUDRAFT_70906 [Coniophora puteana RWD-64-598 SS2]EIW84027.1 hypothetical protein CONPUDRAFT_70906 [Coniophora puteana RWD-64-598 SS2]